MKSGKSLSMIFGLTVVGALLMLGTASVTQAQEEVLTNAFGSATDFSFFWTEVGAPKGDFKPERASGASGVGFQVTFRIPGGFSRTLNLPKKPSTHAKGNSCQARFRRRELTQGQQCADTTVVTVTRIRARRDTTYQEELKIDEFSWRTPVMTLQLGIGFSQSGAFVSRRPENNTRVSVRETPSVSLYADYQPHLPVIGRSIATYVGARTGLLTLIGGSATTPGGTAILNGESFQVGPVAGLVTEFRQMNIFAEGTYMWRNFKSVDWDGETAGANLPRKMNFSGPSFSVGIQFEFRPPDM